MEVQYNGANALKISTKKSVIGIDLASDITPLKIDVKKINTLLASQPVLLPKDTGEAFVINGPGEFEFEDYSIKGVASQAHTAASRDRSATMYWVNVADTRVLITGHISAQLSETQLESIGVVDIVILPVGGGGYTLDAIEAANVVRALEPKLVIPVHSSDDGLKYEVPQAEVDLFVKELGAPVAEDTPEKFKLKSLPEQLTVQLLKKS